jgi:tetraacyldisaccharide 4'-kinase
MDAELLGPTRRARLAAAWREGLPAPWDWLLAAAAWGYRSGLALRGAAYRSGLRRTRRLPSPVVAVGNLTVGGTGKTPLVEHLARALQARGRRVVILSRGYRRQGSGAVELVSDGVRVLLDARAAGDEPYLLARRLTGVPVVVGRDRYRTGQWALARFGPAVLLLDDGFQQMRLAKDVEIVCVAARAPWGRRGLLPRGSLREPPAALGRAHLLVVTGSGAPAGSAAVLAELRRYAPDAPIAHAAYEAEGVVDTRSGQGVDIAQLRARPPLAFAGIAAPESFAATLDALGVRPRAFVAFPDHHAYRPADLAALERRAAAVGAEVLLTTEKDATRLPAPGTVPVWALRVRLRLEDRDGEWWRALDARLGPA